MSALPLSLVVPVYNSAETLPKLVERIAEALAAHGPFELLLVNDGSRDASWAAIEALSGSHAWVRGVNLMRNFGQHNALLAGVRAARGEIIVTLDDDLQNPPEEIPSLLEALREGADVVYGVPQRQQHGVLRDLASSITKLALQQAMGAQVARNISAFRAFRSGVRDAFAEFRSPSVNLDVLLTWGTTRFASRTVRHDARAVGQSNYTVGKLVVHALNMMTGFSTLPLQAASVLGLAMSGFGVLVLAWVLGRYVLQGSSVPGFPFLASIVTLFAGAQLVSLGVIGEYLARMHFRTLDKPPFVIRQTVGRP